MFRRIVALAALPLLLGGTIAFAEANSQSIDPLAQMQEPPLRPERGDRFRRNRGEWLRELNLTSQQVQQMRQIRGEYKSQIFQRHEAARQAQRELVSLMAGDASQDQIRAKFQQVESLKAEAARLRFDSVLAIREILTPEQRQKLAQHLETRRERFRERMPGVQGGRE